jgi:hypothetical protein
MTESTFGRSCFILMALLSGVFETLAGDTVVKQCTWYPEFRSGYGFVIRHHLDMGGYTKKQFPAFEIAMIHPLSGKRRWHQEYNFPEAGISYWYSGLGNTAVLGDVHALTSWLKFTGIEGKNWQWNNRIGTGLGYFKQKFDIHENYKNLAIGSHINASIQLSSSFQWVIHPNATIAIGLGLAHFSNGTMISPNYGINVPWIYSSLAFHKAGSKGRRILKNYEKAVLKNFTELQFSHGYKEIKPLLGPRYNVFAAGYSYFWMMNSRKSFGGGVDVFYDESEKSMLERSGISIESNAELIKPGISGSYQAAYGNLSVLLSLGMYLYQKEKTDGVLYDKFGLRYLFLDRYYIQVFLKTHYARADYLGWGFGIKLKP